MNPFILDILSSDWLLHSGNPDLYAAMVLSMIKGERINTEDFSQARERNRPYVINVAAGGDQERKPINATNLSKGSVAIIPISGVIMKQDVECGPRGTVSIAKDVKSADANPNIKSILMPIDSPGGTSSYSDILSETISNCSKPVIVFVDGTLASAAYWIACGADKIICSSDLNMVGSIGAMIGYMDLKPFFEKQGAVVHEIYATLSTEKNKVLSDIRSGNYETVRKDHLDRTNEKFHATVKANRPGVDPSVFKGNIFHASDAIALGLIDEIGSFEFALEQADTFQKTNSFHQISNNMKSIKMLAVWTAIASFFGFTENIESKELTEEMVGQVNDKLADLTSENSSFKSEVASITSELEKVKSELATLKTSHTSLQSAHAETIRQFEALKAEDAGRETSAMKDGDKTAEELLSDSYSYNRIADQNS